MLNPAQVLMQCLLLISSFWTTVNMLFYISIVFFLSGNHERDWPNTGSFYDGVDSGGECGVPANTLYYVPVENRDKFW